MKRTMLGHIGITMLLLGFGAGQDMLQAQVQYLVGAPYPQSSCNGDPAEFDCNLLGVNPVTIYPHASGKLSAQDVCNLVAQNASAGNPVYVKQLMSDDSRWAYLCGQGFPAGCFTCTGPSCSPIQPVSSEPGCGATDCFCMDPAEAVLIRMTANATVDLGGAPISQSVPLNDTQGVGDIGSYWVGTPGNFATYQDFANALGLTSTGPLRGTMTRVDPATGVTTLILAGTPAAAAPLPNDVAGYRVRNPNPWNWVTNGTVLLPKIRAWNNYYCINGTGDATTFSWAIEISKPFPTPATIIGEPSVTTAAGATATVLAQQLAARINAIGVSEGIHTSPEVPTSGCFSVLNNQSQQGFALWMGPGGSMYPAGNPCAVTQSGCQYNPTITLSGTVPALGTVAMVTVFLLLLIAAAFLLR